VVLQLTRFNRLQTFQCSIKDRQIVAACETRLIPDTINVRVLFIERATQYPARSLVAPIRPKDIPNVTRIFFMPPYRMLLKSFLRSYLCSGPNLCRGFVVRQSGLTRVADPVNAKTEYQGIP